MNKPDESAHRLTLRAMRKLGPSLQQPFDTLIRLANRQLGSQAAWIVLFDEEGKPRLHAHIGLTNDEMPKASAPLIDALFASDAVLLTPAAGARIVVNELLVGIVGVLRASFDDTALQTLRDTAALAAALLSSALGESDWRMQAERTRLASLSSSDWVWESDANGIVAWVSEGVEKHTGKRPDEVIGQSLPQLNAPHGGDPSNSWLRYKEARAKLIPFRDVIADRVKPDGSIVTVSMSGVPVFDDDGRFCGYRGTTRNITERRRAELALAEQQEQLRESQAQLTAMLEAVAAAEERWKFALEGSGDGVWDWDALSNKIYYSTRWKQIRGYAEHEITDSPDEWRSRVHPDDLPHVLNAIRQHVKGETSFYAVDYRAHHRDGHYVWIRDRGKIVKYTPDGRAERIVGTQSDITPSKATEEVLRDKQAAELASQAKSQFLSRMSHEMRTPLNAVIGFSQLLQMNKGVPDAKIVGEYAGHVLDAGEHLLGLIDDVLDLQRIEEGGLSLDMATVDLHEAVTRTIELLGPMAHAREVRFDNQVTAGIWVHADVHRLRQVLINVASNAVKYNQTGGRVQVRIEPPAAEGRVALCVEDNGPGMSAEQSAKLFEPFERLGRETSSVEGTGLGLIIARSLTRAIGGDLKVDSKAGEGTRVRIELQTSTQLPVRGTDKPHLREPAAPQTLRMLYVEDNRINAILFEEAMRMHGEHIELRVAEDGDEALTLAQEWQPDVLVLDAHLPGISGFEVLRLLRRLPGLRDTPAYMCSADALPNDVQRAYEAGFVGYWTKPIDIKSVLADVDHCMHRLRGSSALLARP